jgi:hypothetical protein
VAPPDQLLDQQPAGRPRRSEHCHVHLHPLPSVRRVYRTCL